MLSFQRPRSLAEVVTARLRDEIVDGEFQLGQALSESMIAEKYDVSRTPVREAFACLGLEGLLRTEPQQGTFVFTMDREQFAQMSRTRSILETAALSIVIETNPSALVKHWTRLCAAMAKAAAKEDAPRYSRYDGEFHQILFELADNPFLVAAGQSFSAKMAAVRNRLGSQPEHISKSLEQHIDLLRLVEEGKFRSASELLEHHIRFKGESFWAAADMIEGIVSRAGSGRGSRARSSRVSSRRAYT